MPHHPLRVLLATPSTEMRDCFHDQAATAQVFEVVAHAEDAQEVQSLALAYSPDAILLDTALPHAFECATALRHITLHQSCLLVIDAHEPVEHLITWLQVGACDILELPLTAEHVASALIRGCDRPRLAASSPLASGEVADPRLLFVSKTDGAGERLSAILHEQLAWQTVDQADNLATAVEQALSLHHAVALIDADQFGREAFDIASQMRRYAPTTCVVLLAARADADRVRLAAQSGVCDYLLKPPTIENLGAALTRAQVLSEALAQAMPVSANNDSYNEAVVPQLPPATVDHSRAVVGRLTPRAPVLTVYSPGGGNGCTALACGMAMTLRRRDLRVALVDADMQFGNVAALLGLTPGVTLDQIAERIAFVRWPDEELLHHSSGVHVLPAPASIVQGAKVRAAEVERVVQRLRTHYDAVVVDAPHPLNDHSVRLLKIADHVLVPVRTWETQRQRIAALRELLEAHGFGAQRLHLVQSGFRHDPTVEADGIANLDVIAAQLAAGDPPDLTGLETLTDLLLGNSSV